MAFFFTGDFTGAGASSSSLEKELEEMEMQPCHGTHHHHLEHSYDHYGMEVDSGWETWEYKNDWE